MISYARFNPSRKAEFQLVTSFRREGREQICAKTAATPAARDFLATLPQKFATLHNASLPYDVLPVLGAAEHEVCFPFVSGLTIEAKLLRALRLGDEEMFRETIKLYLDLLYRCPAAPIELDDKFVEIFGTSIKNPGFGILCGCLDLMFGNIILGERPTLIDYEWTFDFPIPRDFIAFRAVTGFLANYAEHRPAQMGDVRELYAMARLTDETVEQFIEAEWRFQRFVNSETSFGDKGGLEDFRESFLATRLWAPNEKPTVQPVSTLQTEVEELRRYVGHLERDIKELREHSSKVEAQNYERYLLIEKMTEDIASLQRSVAFEGERLEQTLQSIEQERVEHRAEIETVTKEVINLHGRLAAAYAHSEALQHELEAVRAELQLARERAVRHPMLRAAERYVQFEERLRSKGRPMPASATQEEAVGEPGASLDDGASAEESKDRGGRRAETNS